jgi:hypothetical protein
VGRKSHAYTYIMDHQATAKFGGEGGLRAEADILTSDILREVVEQLMADKTLPAPPPKLHHFTSLETACRIIGSDNVRLSHSEYSNELRSRSPNPFFGDLFSDFDALAPSLDAYIFCMSTGNSDPHAPQDILSQWRAYGQDGRGACLTLDTSKLNRLVYNTPGLRINPVVYGKDRQTKFVGHILDRGFAAHTTGAANAREATTAALVFVTPLMKAQGFEEEHEWRLIFMPPKLGPRPKLEFQARRDFLAPYLDLRYLWDELQPKMVAIPELVATLPSPRPDAGVPPLVHITHVMIGPSGHQSLNVRAIAKLLNQADRLAVTIQQSQIPYRSLS